MRRLERIFTITVIAAILLAAGGLLGFKLTRWFKPGGVHEENTATVVEQIQTLSDLVTVKYVMEKVIILDDPPSSVAGQFFEGDNRILLLAHGIVKAGIDLKKLKPDDIRVSGKKITVHLPPAQITDAYLDEAQTRVIDWKRGFFRDFDQNLETTARQSAVDDIRRAARENKILDDADERARLELALFLHQAGYDQVEFTGLTSAPSNSENLLHETTP